MYETRFVELSVLGYIHDVNYDNSISIHLRTYYKTTGLTTDRTTEDNLSIASQSGELE
jgi:hypothetical protein